MIPHIMTAQEIMNAFVSVAKDRPLNQAVKEIPVKVCSGPGKDDTHLIKSIYYSPVTQSIWISTEE